MSLFGFISDIFTPAANLVDNLHTSEEEKLTLLNELNKIKAGMQAKSVELMVAEAKSDHWLVAAWRPICALILFSLILLDGFKIVDAPPQVYSLAELFLGVYSGGRSLEKIAKAVKS
jgi:hypothetical protein